MLPSVLMLLAAGWFIACSSEEDVADLPEVPGQGAIGFGDFSSIASETTPAIRSSETPLEEKIQEFTVWGYKNTDLVEGRYTGHQLVFDGYNVKYQKNSAGTAIDNTDGWYYLNNTSIKGEQQTLKYWDFGATAYRFFAFAGTYKSIFKSGDFPMEVDGKTEWMTTISISDIDATYPAYFSRLWFSDNTAEKPFGQVVKLSFFRPFCRVRIMFVDERGEPLKSSSEVARYIDKTSILFEPVADARKVANYGNFFVTYYITGTHTHEYFNPDPAPRPLDPSDPDSPKEYVKINTPYEFHPDDDGNDVESDYALVTPEQKQKWYTLFPSNNTECAFKLTMRYKGMLRTAIVPEEYTRWRVNHEYTYVFKVDDKKMEFHPELFVYNEWQSGYTVDVPVEW